MASPFEALSARRIVLVTGKGGVGRTTIAAAIAHAAAAAGRRTLLAEIKEPIMQGRSPLARKLGRDRLTPDPKPLGERLLGAELCSERGTEHFLTAVFRVGTLAKLALRSQPLLRFLHAVPSFRELGVFYHLLHLLQERAHDGSARHELIVLDMPATGHTLALTGLSDILLRLIPVGPIARAMREGQAILNDPRTGAAYVVTLPEKLPVTESLELIDGLRETGMPVGGIIVNRIPSDPFTDAERAALVEMIGDERVLGMGELERASRAAQSFARLHAAAPDVLRVVEHDEPEGPPIVAAIARALALA